MTRFHDSRWRVAVVLITAVTLGAILRRFFRPVDPWARLVR
jgi:hypothetical protein